MPPYGLYIAFFIYKYAPGSLIFTLFCKQKNQLSTSTFNSGKENRDEDSREGFRFHTQGTDPLPLQVPFHGDTNEDIFMSEINYLFK